MTTYPCDCRSIRAGSVITVSVILGIVATFLQVTATVTVGRTFLWAVFAASVALLGVILTVTALSACCGAVGRCACPLLSTLLVGALGGVLVSNILLGVTLAAVGIVDAVLFGLLVLFFALALLSTAALVRYFFRCDD